MVVRSDGVETVISKRLIYFFKIFFKARPVLRNSVSVDLMLSSFLFSFETLCVCRIDALHQEMPYVMRRSERNLTGNDRYEGFSIDLLKAIAGNEFCVSILIAIPIRNDLHTT